MLHFYPFISNMFLKAYFKPSHGILSIQLNHTALHIFLLLPVLAPSPPLACVPCFVSWLDEDAKAMCHDVKQASLRKLYKGFANTNSMSGMKPGAQGQLNGFTGDAGGNRLKKDSTSGRDLVPFFPAADISAQSEKQNGTSCVKVKVPRTNGAMRRPLS
jgi:hypothetical protein